MAYQGVQNQMKKAKTHLNKFVVQDTTLNRGEMMYFWRAGKHGYTSNLELAHLFTKTEAEKRHKIKETDVAHEIRTLMQLSQRCVSLYP